MTCATEKTRGQLYGTFAFATVIVACYSQYFFVARFKAQPWQVAASFLLGGAYGAFAILGERLAESENPRSKLVYFVTVCALLTAIVFVTPIRGFFGIIVLPSVSQAIFDLGWKGATAVTAYLFAVTIGVFGYFYNSTAMGEAAISLGAAFAFTIVFTVITTQAMKSRTAAEALQGDLEKANVQLQAHANEAEELATTRERNRLAREIHDGVGHYLTVIKTQLDAALAVYPTDPQRAVDSVHKAARLAGEALDDVRRSVGSLAADATRPPLVETLRYLVSDSESVATVKIEGTPRRLPPATEHALYRTAQEGLTNVRKHAAATSATLTLDFRDPAKIRLTLVDNGRGAAVADGHGYGLRGLRERLALLGGTVVGQNRPEGSGFALTAEVPA